MKPTAVEWFSKNLKDFPHIKHSQSFKDLVIKAKEMEKKQIVDTYVVGYGKGITHGAINPEQYYNETFKQEQ